MRDYQILGSISTMVIYLAERVARNWKRRKSSYGPSRRTCGWEKTNHAGTLLPTQVQGHTPSDPGEDAAANERKENKPCSAIATMGKLWFCPRRCRVAIVTLLQNRRIACRGKNTFIWRRKIESTLMLHSSDGRTAEARTSHAWGARFIATRCPE